MLFLDARALLKMLKHDRIPTTLNRNNIQKLEVPWVDTDKDPTDNAEYLEQFCAAFEAKMTAMIKQNVDKMEVMDSYVIEVVQHLKVRGIHVKLVLKYA